MIYLGVVTLCVILGMLCIRLYMQTKVEHVQYVFRVGMLSWCLIGLVLLNGQIVNKVLQGEKNAEH